MIGNGLNQPKLTTTAIEWANREHSLLAIFLKDLIHYKSSARAIYDAHVADGTVGNVDWNQMVFPGHRLSHYYECHARVNFLQIVLSNSPLQLQPEQLDAIWTCLVQNALTREESDQCMQFFQSMLTQQQEHRLSDSTVAYIFERLLPSVSLDKLSEVGFHLVRVLLATSLVVCCFDSDRTCLHCVH